MTLAVILLAAGQSRRFGPQNKLLTDLQGKPLISHAADHIRGLKPDHMIAVTQTEAVANMLEDFTILKASNQAMQSDSIRLGLQAAEHKGAQKAMIVLGDMPFADSTLMGQVAANCSGDRPSATTDGKRILPPACFPKSYFSDLYALKGDKGAAHILRGLPSASLAVVDPAAVFDIDHMHDLKAACGGHMG